MGGGGSTSRVACADAPDGGGEETLGDVLGDDWEDGEGPATHAPATGTGRVAIAKERHALSKEMMDEFCKRLGIGTPDRKKLRAAFNALDKNKTDGLLDVAEFCSGLDMNTLPFWQRVFDAADTDEHLTGKLGAGKLDYQEFLLGLYNFAALPGGDYVAKYLFDLYDVRHDGVLSDAEYRQMAQELIFGIQEWEEDALLLRSRPSKKKKKRKDDDDDDDEDDDDDDGDDAPTVVPAKPGMLFARFRKGLRVAREDGLPSAYDAAIALQAALRARGDFPEGWWERQAERLEPKLAAAGLWSAREFYLEDVCGFEVPRVRGEDAGVEALYLPDAERRTSYATKEERKEQRRAERERRKEAKAERDKDAAEKAAAEEPEKPEKLKRDDSAKQIQKAERGKQGRKRALGSKLEREAHRVEEADRLERRDAQIAEQERQKRERKERKRVSVISAPAPV